MSLHSQGEEIFIKPENAYTKRVGERIASSVGYKISKADGFAAFGGLSDYAGDALGIPSFTVELGKGKNPLSESTLPRICDAVRKILVFLPAKL